jgi:hypothetical protein
MRSTHAANARHLPEGIFTVKVKLAGRDRNSSVGYLVAVELA